MALRSLATRSARPFAASSCAPRPRRAVSARSGAPSPEQLKQMEEAMKDPAMAAQMKTMQSMMQKPEVQQQMQEMAAYLQNQQLQKRLEELKDDPELAGMFEDIRKNGAGAMMKYWNDPKTLAKLGSKLGDIAPAAAPAAAAARPPPGYAPPAPEVTNLLEAARYGDMEAVEDFIAIGKDVNEGDAEGRSPLHYAVATAHENIARLLIAEGANLEAVDSKQNTPLHYAAGYGRAGQVEVLLDAGADVTAKNSTGKTPGALVRMEPRNPLNEELELLQRLPA